MSFDLAAAARQEMLERGFQPDIPAEVESEVSRLPATPQELSAGIRDLRALPWSSIDNDDSRDLDQIEYAEPVQGGTRVMVGIADVDALVRSGSATDCYAGTETTTVYTGVRIFPMLPERLSTDLTSLAEGADRLALVIEFVVGEDGSVRSSSISRALVRNAAQLAYSAVGAWLEGQGSAPQKLAGSPEFQQQLRLQDQAAQRLCEERHRLGALSFDRVEAEPKVTNSHVEIGAHKSNRATALIEDFMIAANEVLARTLRDAGVPCIRRVVKAPERWERIATLAAQHGERLPAQPDAGALNRFLQKRKAADPLSYPELSLAVLKLMGPGEYVLSLPGEPQEEHFGLAAHDYTHSTAPNRRYADLVTQRLIKAWLARAANPYTADELATIARNCTLKEDAARKVQRDMYKRIAAAAMQDRIGQSFAGVVTGVTPKGVFARVFDPPIEGRIMRGEQALDVGDRVRLTLLAADPRRGFIDFAV